VRARANWGGVYCSRPGGQNGGVELKAWGVAANRTLATPGPLTPNCRPTEASERPRESRWTKIEAHGLATVLLIVGIWVLVAFLINLRGEFPLNDDWAYAGAVKALLNGEGIKLAGRITTNVIAQVFWGALFCLPFGFSFTALRLSTFVLGGIGVLTLYALLREADADRKTALFGALLLAFNPLYLSLSYTFMSDVPFTAISILSLYLFVRGMRRDSRLDIAAGLFFACVALLIRQNGLAIFVAFSLAYLAKSVSRRNLFLASMPVALGGAVQVLWDRWMTYRHVRPATHSLMAVWVLSPGSYASWHAVEPFAAQLVIVSVYLGLFLFPLLLFVGGRRWAELCRSRPLIVATLAFAVFASFALSYRRMPLFQNVFYDLGLGPATLRDAFLLRLPSLPTGGRPFWFVVTYLGYVGAVPLFYATLVAMGKALKLLPLPTGKRELLVVLLASALMNIVPVAILGLMGQAFDRYLLFLVPLGITLIIFLAKDVSPGKPRFPLMPLAVLGVFLYGAFSVAGTHDYLSWNRARWQALNNLMTGQQISAHDIDGGYEFNCWYLYDQDYRMTPEKSWWFVDGDDYLVTFGRVSGYRQMKRYPFPRWLPPARGNILVLRRTPSTPR